MLSFTGGIHGVAFTHKDHRGLKLSLSASVALTVKSYLKDEVVLGETWKPSLNVPHQLSNGIVLQKPKTMANL